MSAEARPGRRPRGTGTADRVLTAALEVYATEGFEGFTITAVIARSGVSSGSVYHHFGNLDGLYAALYARCMADLMRALADKVTAADDARAGVDALVLGYLDFVRENRVAAHFIHASSYARFLTAQAQPREAAPREAGRSQADGRHHGGAAAVVGAAKAPELERIVGWFRPRIAAGQIVDLPESLIEILAIGPVAEVSRRWLAGAPGYDLDEAARLLPERIWRSLRAPGARDL